MDFTLKTYRQLLEALKGQETTFQTFASYLEAPANRAIILRHDVEAKYRNALEFAWIQHEYGIRGSYYFRFLPDHFDTGIIREISEMGHEIGYHYDDLSYCHGNYDDAIRRFEKNLATLREIAEVKTICMEGAPLSKWDNRLLWGSGKEAGSWQLAVGQDGQQSTVSSQRSAVKTQRQEPGTRNYKCYGIIGEPYFDLDFSKVLYLTDTGRRWDGKASVRDKVGSRQSAVGGYLSSSGSPSPNWRGGQGVRLKSTPDIISAIKTGLLPDQVMITFHPQRWTDKPLPWMKELVMQNIKNIVKRIVLRFEG